jgi:molecular chaperone DnaJ
VRLAGKGEAGPRGGPQGDLYVVTRVAASDIFERKGDNLEVEVPITIPEAIRGATIEVPTLNGSKRIRVPSGTQHGTVQRLRGEGPPKLGGRGRGDIRYRLVVDVPRSLSREQAEVVDELATVMDGNPRSRLLSGRGE